MAAFTVKEGGQWSRTFILGVAADRWRLDDWHIYADFVAPGAGAPACSVSTAEGGISISDPVARRMEVSLNKTQVAALTTGATYAFDFLLINKATGRVEWTSGHTLSVERVITKEPA